MDGPPRCGDYPELFWDAQPDARIDVGDSVTLARLLTRGSPETIGRPVSLDVIQALVADLERCDPGLAATQVGQALARGLDRSGPRRDAAGAGAEGCKESFMDSGHDISQPAGDESYSGRVLLRLPRSVNRFILARHAAECPAPPESVP